MQENVWKYVSIASICLHFYWHPKK